MRTVIINLTLTELLCLSKLPAIEGLHVGWWIAILVNRKLNPDPDIPLIIEIISHDTVMVKYKPIFHPIFN